MRLPGAILTLLASNAAATNSTCVPVCTNECVGGPANYTKDGWCDDGGPGWSTDRCSLGTDCDDCGDSCREKPLPSPTADDELIDIVTPESPEAASPSPSPPACVDVCTNECIGNPTWANDGWSKERCVFTLYGGASPW